MFEVVHEYKVHLNATRRKDVINKKVGIASFFTSNDLLNLSRQLMHEAKRQR